MEIRQKPSAVAEDICTMLSDKAREGVAAVYKIKVPLLCHRPPKVAAPVPFRSSIYLHLLILYTIIRQKFHVLYALIHPLTFLFLHNEATEDKPDDMVEEVVRTHRLN